MSKSDARYSRLLIVELVMPEASSPSLGQLLDLHMLVELGGRERTEPEWQALLEQSGFRLAAIRPAPPWSVLEAVPV
jgi:O-methyltransferase